MSNEIKYNYDSEVFRNDDYVVDSDGTVSFIGESETISYTDLVCLLAEKLQQQKAENEELRKQLGRPYIRRFDLENNKLTNKNTQLKQQLEVAENALKNLVDMVFDNLEYDEIKYRLGEPMLDELIRAKQALSQIQKVEE